MTDKGNKEIGRTKSPYLFMYITIIILVLLIILLGIYVFQNASLFGEELVLSNQNTQYPTITLATIPPSETSDDGPVIRQSIIFC